MPLNEASAKPRRPRFPLEFDLAGVPRDTTTRKRLLEEMKENMSPSNVFLSDKAAAGANPLAAMTEEQKADLLDLLLKQAPVGKEIDLSKPVVHPYNPRDPKNQYPRMLYHHKTGHTLTVKDARQEKAASARGYQREPSEEHDYSAIPSHGIAPRKAATVTRPKPEFTAEDLAELDEQEAES